MGSSGLPPVRRVVTGHDGRGRAVIRSDQRFPTEDIDPPVASFALMWTTATVPVDNNDETDGRERNAGLTIHGGSVIRVVDMLPGGASPMHRTSSIAADDLPFALTVVRAAGVIQAAVVSQHRTGDFDVIGLLGDARNTLGRLAHEIPSHLALVLAAYEQPPVPGLAAELCGLRAELGHVRLGKQRSAKRPRQQRGKDHKDRGLHQKAANAKRELTHSPRL